MAAPTVVTDAAKYVAKYSATLVGHSPWVDPGEAVSYIIFEWGKTTAYGNWTYWKQAFAEEVYYHDIAGLEGGTAYHFRIVGRARTLRSYGADKTFTTTTVSPAPSPTPFMGWMVKRLVGISDQFYNVYLVVIGWVWPFYLTADFFYWLHSLSMKLAWDFYDFSLWVDDIAGKILTVLSFGDIYSYFKDLFDAAISAWDWVKSSFSNVWNIVGDWWDNTKREVQGWIDIATQGFDNLVVAWDEFWTYTWPRWTDELDLLAADWGNFFTHKLPTLFDIRYAEEWWRSKVLDITGIIDTWFKSYEPLWAGWQDWRDKVVEFFTDPLEWLLGKFTDWFLGPEE